MIYTLTFNPSLDYIMHVDSFLEGKTNRSSSEEIYPGGKGFNVSTVLTRLGIDNIALGFVAGFTGVYIEQTLQERSIKTNLIHLDDGMSRINVKMKGASETEINGNGPIISKDQLDDLFSILKSLRNDDILVLAGSIPSSLPKDIYASILKQVNCESIVDASGDLLRNVLMYRPLLIKPNLDELEEFFHCKVESKDHLISLMKSLQDMGAKNVIVSLGKKGACLLDEIGMFYYQEAFSGTLVNSVGSGDSMIAGFIAAYNYKKTYPEILRFACACGSATAFSSDLASKEEIEKIYRLEEK